MILETYLNCCAFYLLVTRVVRMNMEAAISFLSCKMNRFDPGKKIRRELGSQDFKIPNIDEVDGIFLATAQGFDWAKPSYRIIV